MRRVRTCTCTDRVLLTCMSSVRPNRYEWPKASPLGSDDTTATAELTAPSPRDVALGLVAELATQDLITVAVEDVLVERLLAGDEALTALAGAYKSSRSNGQLARAVRQLSRHV